MIIVYPELWTNFFRKRLIKSFCDKDLEQIKYNLTVRELTFTLVKIFISNYSRLQFRFLVL